jgi:hypothetical protein
MVPLTCRLRKHYRLRPTVIMLLRVITSIIGARVTARILNGDVIVVQFCGTAGFIVNIRKSGNITSSPSAQSPLARLVLFMVCLTVPVSIITSVYYFTVDLPQQKEVQAPINYDSSKFDRCLRQGRTDIIDVR